MKLLKRSLKITIWFIVSFVGFLLVYVVSALGLSRISVNSEVVQEEKAIEIFILSNGVHTDIVVPIKNEIKDWRNEIQFQQTKSNDSVANYLAFGWGDKGFYLETPTWADLKASTAIKAATGLSSSAMHTAFYKNLSENDNCRKIQISKENYQKLVTYISESFQRDSKQNNQWIAGHSYGKNDAFYEAKGSYSLFYTCNTWTNNALKSANLKACFWTPYDKGILYHYK